VTRTRRPEDWAADLANARAVEQQVGDVIRADHRLADVDDRTASFDQLDFRFRSRGGLVTLDVKEKRQAYSRGIGDLWRELPEPEMFVVDETVFRRVVWQGGGGYLLIHDVARQAVGGIRAVAPDGVPRVGGRLPGGATAECRP
jgi:hypothetical protein